MIQEDSKDEIKLAKICEEILDTKWYQILKRFSLYKQAKQINPNFWKE